MPPSGAAPSRYASLHESSVLRSPTPRAKLAQKQLRGFACFDTVSKELVDVHEVPAGRIDAEQLRCVGLLHAGDADNLVPPGRRVAPAARDLLDKDPQVYAGACFVPVHFTPCEMAVVFGAEREAWVKGKRAWFRVVTARQDYRKIWSKTLEILEIHDAMCTALMTVTSVKDLDCQKVFSKALDGANRARPSSPFGAQAALNLLKLFPVSLESHLVNVYSSTAIASSMKKGRFTSAMADIVRNLQVLQVAAEPAGAPAQPAKDSVVEVVAPVPLDPPAEAMEIQIEPQIEPQLEPPPPEAAPAEAPRTRWQPVSRDTDAPLIRQERGVYTWTCRFCGATPPPLAALQATLSPEASQKMLYEHITAHLTAMLDAKERLVLTQAAGPEPAEQAEAGPESEPG
ncbi:hypothetical protein DFJ74DRAFT_512995 [Hyaloraphidium curvatum]|nr:hypothetical protein DFJ74DRAFT_512995 [Hyaloraphidium curvatum]